jgi:hypothetical protein
LIKTAWRLSWKSKSAKKWVTTYMPNHLALKMDDAEREWTNNLDQSEENTKKEQKNVWYKNC